MIIQTSKFYEVQKYLTISRHVYTPFIVLASKKWWDGLSADERKVVQDVGDRTRQYQRTVSREMVQQSLQDLQGKGMQVNELSPAEMEKVRDRVKPVIEKYTGVLGAADVFTPDVAFWLMESIRLNRGYGLQVHP